MIRFSAAAVFCLVFVGFHRQSWSLTRANWLLTLWLGVIEAGVELGAIVGLDHQDTNGQSSEDGINEPDRPSLVAGIIVFPLEQAEVEPRGKSF